MEAKLKPPIIVLTGPTAVGKTEASLMLANAIGGEIISADSMQVYRYMDIGTAKIHSGQMQGIPHYLIDEWDPDEEFNVYLFQKKAKEYIEDIHARGNIPILTGGTGFYIQAVLYDIAFPENQDNTSIREQLQREAEERGEHYLHEKLRQIDPESAETIHQNNRKRMIRALEYYMMTGEKFSVHNQRERRRTSPYQFLYIVLTMNRESLYERIDARVEQMVEDGLIKEVQSLLDRGCGRELVSMQGLGYKETAAALSGEYTMEEAIYRIKRNTRRFAKRQMTWFRREREVVMLPKEEYPDTETMVKKIIELASKKGILGNN